MQVLQPTQVARLVVQSYPFRPDLLQIMTLIAEDDGEPPIAELLAAGCTPDAGVQAGSAT